MIQAGTNQAKEVWCQVKSSDNNGGMKWQICQKCCVFCDDNNCPIRVCHNSRQDDLCCWRCSPAEWLMGRMNDEARLLTYKIRRYEFEIRNGARAGDGSWIGGRLEKFRKEHPKEYEEILAKEGK